MADKQPSNVNEGATTGDVEDEAPPSAAPKSAEDRKAASALASLDATDYASSSTAIDQDAVKKAMKNLPGRGAAKPGPAGPGGAAGPVKKNVKVDAADVTLLVDELDLTKSKATELLKAHDGDAIKALRTYLTV